MVAQSALGQARPRHPRGVRHRAAFPGVARPQAADRRLSEPGRKGELCRCAGGRHRRGQARADPDGLLASRTPHGFVQRVARAAPPPSGRRWGDIAPESIRKDIDPCCRNLSPHVTSHPPPWCASALPAPAIDAPADADTQTVVLAGGCFWGVQAVFQHTKGVTQVLSGYAGGSKETAQYNVVSSGRTSHAEAVQISFDPRQISYGAILQIYFSVA